MASSTALLAYCNINLRCPAGKVGKECNRAVLSKRGCNFHVLIPIGHKRKYSTLQEHAVGTYLLCSVRKSSQVLDPTKPTMRTSRWVRPRHSAMSVKDNLWAFYECDPRLDTIAPTSRGI